MSTPVGVVATPVTTPRRAWWALAVLMLPVLLIAIDNTVLAFALPMIGPKVDPAVKQEAQIAMASRRAEASAKMLRINDRVDGISMAPKTPSTARATTRYSALGANAAMADTTANPVAPIISSRRRPIRSPRLPMATSSAASTSE